MKTICRIGAVSALLITGTAPSQAQTSILANTFGPGDGINSAIGYSADRIQQVAEPFSTGDSAYTLTQIDIAFFNAVGGPIQNSLSLSVETSAANGLPGGTVLEVFTFTNISAPTVLNAVSVLHPILSRNQTYWVVAAAGDSSSVLAWDLSPLPITGILANNDGPGTPFRSDDTGTPAVYRVSAAPVPEPSSFLTFAVAALGLGGLLVAARRKKANAKRANVTADSAL